MLLLAWLMSSHKKKVSPRVVVGGLILQIVFALLILKTSAGQSFFQSLGDFFTGVLSYVDEGSAFLFDIFPRPSEENGFPPQFTLWRSFAFGILPTIIFFSSLMSILYHLGVMQWVVKFFAVIMQKTLGTSGAETLSAAANIFVGQTEAPLVIRPYVKEMTISELNVVMVGGFATIAGGVLAAYVGMGIDAGHLITASVISAPAALMIAKILQPETEVSKTAGTTNLTTEKTGCVNVIEAAAEGASSGLQLALNVGAMLIAFVALVAMGNAIVGWSGGMIANYTGYSAASEWTLQKGFGYLFYPFAWLMGIPANECLQSGEILGTKMVVNEFVAYINLSGVMSDPETAFSDRTKTILTYALCGFANFSSIGIQLGGIGGIAPERRADLAKLGLRAMFGGTLAAFMTACIAGMLLPV
jgi:CNT family concentrative nucleoside transporter